MSYSNRNNRRLPPRVRAAFRYLTHCRWVTSCDDHTSGGRQLSPNEQRVADAALDVLTLYFTGEMDYGDAPPRASTSSLDDDAGESSFASSDA
ncbi:MAG: hypothetical protein AAF432_09220 [Planctomycetota bacterium]